MKKWLFCDDWLFGEKGKEKRPVFLPHDAMQQQGRREDAASGSGGAFFQGGTYEYEKSFLAPEAWEDQDVFLEFEGVYPNAAVYLNDVRIGGCQYGYTLFRVALDGLAYGNYNTLRIEVDNSRLPNSRWYSGAGIYRPVWMIQGSREHIKPDGIRITTLSWDPAQIRVETEHTCKDSADVHILTEIFYEGKKVAEGSGEDTKLYIPDAHLWDADSPSLYQCKVSLVKDGRITDVQSTDFGIRKIAWSVNGLTVNGKEVLLKGGCIHHDNGILGARTYDKSEWRRIRRLKEFGFNAIRSSHNPLCRAALEACDALGMYVIDELWDMWDVSKNPFDYAKDFKKNYEADIKSMTAKDYNHPSVIMYSIGNEVTEPGTQEGMVLAAKIMDKLKSSDATRPVTAGINLTLLLLASMKDNPLKSENSVPDTEQMNSTAYNKMVSQMGNSMVLAAATEGADKIASPVLDMLDIAGYNYAVSRYEKESELHPDRIIVGSETYAYDLPRTWKMVEKYPYVTGDFMWTAWDYLGEVGIGSWSYGAGDMGFHKNYPWLLADAGAIDILGNDNAEAGMAAVVWGKRKRPYIAAAPVNHPGVIPNKAIWRGSNAMPYWSYRGCEGNEADIEVYSSAHEVELFLNGRSAGRKKLQDYKAEFHTIYEAGELRAVAYNGDGSIHSESCLRSADGQIRICIMPEDEIVKKGDIVYVDISLTGENGEVECGSDTRLRVTAEGGEVLAFGSANPKTAEDFLAGEYTTYYGRSQAVVKATGEKLIIRVSSDGLQAAFCEIMVSESKGAIIKESRINGS